MENLELLKTHLKGLEIVNIYYDGEYSAPISIVLSNGYVLTVDANGDDMAHTVINVNTHNGFNLISI